MLDPETLGILKVVGGAIGGSLVKPFWDWMRGNQKVTLSQHRLDKAKQEIVLVEARGEVATLKVLADSWKDDRRRLVQLEERQTLDMKRIADLDTERAKLQSKHDDLAELAAATDAALAGAREEMNGLREQIETLQQERDELRADLDESRGEIAALRAQLEAANLEPIAVPQQARHKSGKFKKAEGK